MRKSGETLSNSGHGVQFGWFYVATGELVSESDHVVMFSCICFKTVVILPGCELTAGVAPALML